MCLLFPSALSLHSCAPLFLLSSIWSLWRGREASCCSRASIFDPRHVRTREMLHLESYSPLEFKTDSRQVILPVTIISHPFSPTCPPISSCHFSHGGYSFFILRAFSFRVQDPVAAFRRYGFSIGVIRTLLPRCTFSSSPSWTSDPFISFSGLVPSVKSLALRRVFLTHCQPRVMDGGSCATAYLSGVDRYVLWTPTGPQGCR